MSWQIRKISQMAHRVAKFLAGILSNLSGLLLFERLRQSTYNEIMKIYSTSEFTILDFMKIHLDVLENPVTISDGGNIWSCLIGILRDARKVTGRNIKTGLLHSKSEEWKDGDPGSWIGAIAYMTAIDQLGSAYGSHEKNSTRWPSVLIKFAGLSEVEARTLYQLRCCLIHEASLIDERAKQPLAFEVSGSGEPLIRESSEVWNGDLYNLTREHSTKIDLRKFGDTVETCVNEHKKWLLHGRLTTRYSKNEFMKKFIFGTRLGAVVG